MPSFPIIDTHLHLWDPSHIRYPWLDGVPLLNKPYLLPDYKSHCGEVRVSKMVFVQCEADLEFYREETEWVTALAGDDPRIKGIVSWAPLEKGAAARPELAELAKNRLVKGIRRIIQFEPDPGFCLQPGFIEGVRMLPEFGFRFDICIHHGQMPQTLDLVRQCPETAFILDHIGKPAIRDGVLDPWRRHIEEFAAMDNVVCKVSGLVTEADHSHWREEQLQPYLDHVFDTFGPDRVLYGGDWPVAYQAIQYIEWVSVLDRFHGQRGTTLEDQHKFFVANAESFYGI